jgi:hypothetical protein
MLGITTGILATATLALLFAVLSARGSTPLLTEERLAAAEQLWAAQGPHSYNLDVTLGGSQRGHIHVEVRDDQVINMTRDGHTPKQRRTWDYWTVPSQFDTIRQDMALAQHPQRPFGVGSPEQVVLRVEFDPHYGYPTRYQRSVSGAPYDVEWQIDRFEVK